MKRTKQTKPPCRNCSGRPPCRPSTDASAPTGKAAARHKKVPHKKSSRSKPRDYESMTVFEQLQSGLEDSITYSQDELQLKTTSLPSAPPSNPRAKRAKRKPRP